MIDSFRGRYSFLSNFYSAYVEYEGIIYPNNEAAFQSAKTFDDLQKLKLSVMENPTQAKRYGKSVKLREDWESIKLEVMTEVCLNKFTQNPELGQKLIDTYPHELVEGNNWNDCYWGVCRGKGDNYLGKILMGIRSHLTNNQ